MCFGKCKVGKPEASVDRLLKKPRSERSHSKGQVLFPSQLLMLLRLPGDGGKGKAGVRGKPGTNAAQPANIQWNKNSKNAEGVKEIDRTRRLPRSDVSADKVWPWTCIVFGFECVCQHMLAGIDANELGTRKAIAPYGSTEKSSSATTEIDDQIWFSGDTSGRPVLRNGFIGATGGAPHEFPLKAVGGVIFADPVLLPVLCRPLCADIILHIFLRLVPEWQERNRLLVVTPSGRAGEKDTPVPKSTCVPNSLGEKLYPRPTPNHAWHLPC